MPQHKATDRLTPAPPFDFAKSLDFVGYFSPAMGEQEVVDQTLTKATSFDGQVLAFTVRSVGTVDKPDLEYALVSDEPMSGELERAAADRIGFYLSINDDLRPFYEIAARDEAFAPVVSRLYGLHQVKFLTPFENAAWAVLSQRNPMPVARKVKDRLTEQYGGSITVDGTLYRSFPEASVIASLPEEELFGIVKNERRTEYLKAIASAFAGADENFLRNGAYSEVEAWLRAIKGIGAWSAAFIMLRGLGHMDGLTPDESRLSTPISRVYGNDLALTDKGTERIAANYGSYMGYWAYYLRTAG